MTSLPSKLGAKLLVCVVLLTARALPAQTITFAQFSDLQSFSPAAVGTDAQRDEQALQSQYALVWAVAEINRMVRSGKRLDFVLIGGGLGLKGASPRPIERLRPLRAVLAPAIYLLPGENDVDLDAQDPLREYRSFCADLKALINNKEVRDLTSEVPVVSGIQILGFDSTLLANHQGNNSNPLRALEEIDRVGKLAMGWRCVVFTHMADFDDPRRLAQGSVGAASWRTTPATRDAWNRLLAQPGILAVFAGHILTSAQSVYSKDYSYALNKPSALSVAKTWLSPPLATVAGLADPQPLRGFQTATVAQDGSVSVSLNWFSPPVPGADLADKAEKIVEAQAYEHVKDFEKAAAAYQQALSSKDASIRRIADAGFQRTVQLAKHIQWTNAAESWFLRLVAKWWLDALLIVGVLLLLAVAEGWGNISYHLGSGLRAIFRRPLVVIGPIVKGNDGAPVAEFTIQFQLAIEDIRSTLQPTSARSTISAPTPVIVSLGHGWQSWSFFVIDKGSAVDSRITTPPIGGDLPELRIAGVELRAVLAWIRALKNLLRRRVEIQVYGSSQRLQLFAVQRFTWIEEERWTVPSPGSSADVVDASRLLAYCIMSQGYIR
jgi:hypothetical protein